MSSEAINSTTAPTPASQEAVFTIDGKDYKKSDLNPKTFNSIVVRQDLQATKIKLTLEFKLLEELIWIQTIVYKV